MFEPGSQPAVFFQPHSDDVALSCGGTAAACAAAGTFSHILSAFSGEILPQMVGALARQKHKRWNLQDVDVMFKTRRNEDRQAADALGCTIRWLGLPDAIYRGDRYPTNKELFGPLHDEELGIAEHLAMEVVGLPEWRTDAAIFVPLGVGSHVDHQILFELGRLLAMQGYNVSAYEDTPYVVHSPQELDRRLQAVGAHVGASFTTDISTTLDAKLDAIDAYTSQIPVIFRFTDNWRGTMRAHALSCGGGVPVERFWPLISKSAND